MRKERDIARGVLPRLASFLVQFANFVAEWRTRGGRYSAEVATRSETNDGNIKVAGVAERLGEDVDLAEISVAGK